MFVKNIVMEDVNFTDVLISLPCQEMALDQKCDSLLPGKLR